MGYSEDDVMKMPTSRRRFYLHKFLEEGRKRKEMVENAKGSSNGSGRRTNRISGNELVSKIKSGEINPHA